MNVVISTFLLFSIFGATIVSAQQDPDVPQDSVNNEAPSSEESDDIIKQVMSRECRGNYSAYCLKLGLVKLVSRGAGATIALIPGVSISSTPGPRPLPVMASNLLNDPEKVDAILLDRLSDYLGSVSINIRVMDKAVPMSFARTILGENVFSGRAKNKYGGALAAAGLMSGGSLLALGMAALAAMAGKALMASMLALMLAALAALKGNGGGGGEKTHYEVITKPVVSHIATHSSEVQHGHHGHYKRSIDAHSMAYAGVVPKSFNM